MENEIPKYFPTKYWHTLENGRVQCDLCPHACKLNENQRGMCFVRERHDDQVVLTTYGRSSGFCIDPVEKKPLNHFLPGTSVFSFGTAGCNLACRFCQNWDISKSREMDTLCDAAMPEDIARAAYDYNCASVAYTYNEPIIFLEYAVDVAKECHKLGIKSIAVTNGYICDEPRREFFANMDAAIIGLKGFTEDFYQKIIGGHLQPVLDTLLYVKRETNVWLEVVTLLIPGENDSEEELDLETKWIVENLGPDVPVHFTAFHPAWKMLNKPPTPMATVKRAREIAMRNGVRYAFTGNITDVDGSSTYCHNCNNKLIERTGYQITQYNLTSAGACKFCGTPCSGMFAESLGKWDGRMRPVHMSK